MFYNEVKILSNSASYFKVSLKKMYFSELNFDQKIKELMEYVINNLIFQGTDKGKAYRL